MALKKLRKQPAESRLYDFDFTLKLVNGATVVSVTSIIATKLDKVAGSTNVTVNQIASSTSRAQCRISDGTDKEDYKLTALVVDSAGNTLELDGILQVRAE